MNTAPNVFTPAKLGPVTLRNRIIKAATFEAASPNALVTDDLISYHRLPAAGGVGMTTVAYLAVTKGGRTEGHVIWWRPEAIPGLQSLTEAIHAEGAAISAQIAHAGPVANARSDEGEALCADAVLQPALHAFARGPLATTSPTSSRRMPTRPASRSMRGSTPSRSTSGTTISSALF